MWRLSALAVVGLSLVATGCNASAVSDEFSSPAQKLATLDGSGDVATFQRHLDSLKGKCLESEERIAALVYGTQKTMADKGVHESLADLIAHLDQSLPANAPRQHCEVVFAAYATLRIAK